MAAKRPGRKPSRRYGWVSLVPSAAVRSLSPPAQTGMWYAEQLARNRAERRGAAVLHGHAPGRLTVKQLAAEEDVSPFEIPAAIKRARIELFGRDLSDSAVYYRLRRQRQLADQAPRLCQQPDCAEQLPATATARRRFCDLHGSASARVQRHRQGTGAG